MSRMVESGGDSRIFSGETRHLAVSLDATITSSSSRALAVGVNGYTNPAFVVDNSTAGTLVTGVKVTAKAAASGAAIAAISSATNENLTLDAKGTGTLTLQGTATGAIVLGTATGITGALTITSASASALTVGRQGATNPAFQVDASTALQLTGLKVTAAGTGGGVAVAVVESGGTNNALTINAMGSGSVTINNTATGAVILGRALVKNNTVVAYNSSSIVAAADIVKGYITSTSVGAVTLTLPTAAAIADIIGASQGTVFDFYVDNALGGNAITIAFNGGGSIAAITPVITGGASLALAAGQVGAFRLIFVSATAAFYMRLA